MQKSSNYLVNVNVDHSNYTSNIISMFSIYCHNHSDYNDIDNHSNLVYLSTSFKVFGF
jgi:hypothetical protein